MAHFIDLSTKLTQLLREKGPLPINSVAQEFQMRFGEPFNLKRRGLKKCMSEGLLLRIIYKQHEGSTCLAIRGVKAKPKIFKGSASDLDDNTVEDRKQQAGQQLGVEEAGARFASSEVFVISDPTSYCKALEMIVPKAQELGVTTLEQACVGHTVALSVVGRDLIGAENSSISHIQVALGTATTLSFGIQELESTKAGKTISRAGLCGMLNNSGIMKVTHDVTSIVVALKRHFGAVLKLKSVLDTQLAYEALGNEAFGSFDVSMKWFDGQGRYYEAATLGERPGASSNSKTTEVTRQATATAASLAKVFDTIQQELTCKNKWQTVLDASQMRADFAAERLIGDRRRMAFCNHGSCWGGGIGRRLISAELKMALSQSKMEDTSNSCENTKKEPPLPHQTPAPVDDTSGIAHKTRKEDTGEVVCGNTPEVQEDPNSPLGVLQLVPQVFLNEHLTERHTDNLRDLHELVLDEGARPRALLEGRRKVYLCSDENIRMTKEDIHGIVGELERDGSIGNDNRAGFPGQLHRLSVMRDKQRNIYAVTLRIGRFFKGIAGIIDDLLFHSVDPAENAPSKAPSILILGEPGSGKTTVIRDLCQKLSTSQTVVIVDTSNEIAGEGTVPHREAIGESRRLMVASKENQYKVMIEALQNHTPQTIVVDEISNSLEAKACMDIKARGVRLVASAHGNLQSLLSNPTMNTLIGGKTSVTLGDSFAQATNCGRKVLVQRAGPPIFDAVVELQMGKVNTWTIVQNVGLAVDAILEDRAYDVQRRIRIEDDHQTADCDGDTSFFMQLDREEKKAAVYYNLG